MTTRMAWLQQAVPSYTYELSLSLRDESDPTTRSTSSTRRRISSSLSHLVHSFSKKTKNTANNATKDEAEKKKTSPRTNNEQNHHENTKDPSHSTVVGDGRSSTATCTSSTKAVTPKQVHIPAVVRDFVIDKSANATTSCTCLPIVEQESCSSPAASQPQRSRVSKQEQAPTPRGDITTEFVIEESPSTITKCTCISEPLDWPVPTPPVAYAPPEEEDEDLRGGFLPHKATPVKAVVRKIPLSAFQAYNLSGEAAAAAHNHSQDHPIPYGNHHKMNQSGAAKAAHNHSHSHSIPHGNHRTMSSDEFIMSSLMVTLFVGMALVWHTRVLYQRKQQPQQPSKSVPVQGKKKKRPPVKKRPVKSSSQPQYPSTTPIQNKMEAVDVVANAIHSVLSDLQEDEEEEDDVTVVTSHVLPQEEEEQLQRYQPSPYPPPFSSLTSLLSYCLFSNNNTNARYRMPPQESKEEACSKEDNDDPNKKLSLLQKQLARYQTRDLVPFCSRAVIPYYCETTSLLKQALLEELRASIPQQQQQQQPSKSKKRGYVLDALLPFGLHSPADQKDTMNSPHRPENHNPISLSPTGTNSGSAYSFMASTIMTQNRFFPAMVSAIANAATGRSSSRVTTPTSSKAQEASQSAKVQN